MTISHHLPPALLMAYAAGDLPHAFSLVVATHLSLCDACRAEAAAFDAVGGAMLDRAPEVAMSAGALDACLARIAAAPDAPAKGQPPQRRDAVLPGPLMDCIGGGLDAVKWRPIGMGAKQAILPSSDKGSTVRLLYIPAGTAIPDHGHAGLELTQVLQGAFRDGTTRFARGDVEVADAEVNHTPIAETGDACICLAATQGSLKFNAWLPRLAQPFLRI